MEKTIREKISNRIIVIGIAMGVLSCVVFYALFVPGLEQDAIERAENTNTEVISQVDTLVSFVQDYTENLALSVAQNEEILRYFSDPEEQNRNIASLNLNNLISYEGSIRCVMISSQNVPALDSLSEVDEADRELIETSWYKNLEKAEYGRGVSGVYKVTINNAEKYTAAYLKNFYHGNQKYTYVVFMELNDLIRTFRVLTDHTLDYAELVDGNGDVICSQGNERWQEKAHENVEGNQQIVSEKGNNGIQFIDTSLTSKWQVASYVADRTIFMTFAYYIIGAMVVLCLFVLVTLAVLSKVIGKIIEPISILSAGMKEVAKGNLDCRIEEIPDDEIGLLSDSFNKMAEELKDSLDVIARKEKEEQQTRFSLLISQIDPHFIYNTINSINYLARRERCKDIIKVNSALIFILQDRLRINNIEFTDTIENEKKVIEQYIVIERYMYDGNLELIWEIEEGLSQEQIPKNMLQPLVENALFHGLIDEESGELNGKIVIHISKKEEEIIAKVEDNGMGMDEEQLRKVRRELYGEAERGKSIGLSNIRKRLEYLYGSTESIKIESEKGKGTCITLIFKSRYFI
ncbi:ATP-binding protein [Claveliimonas sp.]|uniref:sensor histidine kinase n=1 Tax=Claveliimonas sp. TaxID=3076672 RepID=UPI00307BBFD1